eukprot:2809821-Rhodomonas_salina.5
MSAMRCPVLTKAIPPAGACSPATPTAGSCSAPSSLLPCYALPVTDLRYAATRTTLTDKHFSPSLLETTFTFLSQVPASAARSLHALVVADIPSARSSTPSLSAPTSQVKSAICLRVCSAEPGTDLCMLLPQSSGTDLCMLLPVFRY